MFHRPTLRVGAKAALKMLQRDRRSIGLLITNTLREFVPLNLSIPVIYISPSENDRQLDQIGMFSAIVVLRQPLAYGSLLSAVRQLCTKC